MKYSILYIIDQFNYQYIFEILNNQIYHSTIMIVPNRLSYTILQQPKTAKTQAKLTNQQRFWKKLKIETVNTYKSAVNNISSNKNKANTIIYSSGSSIFVYNPLARQIVREITHFTQTVSALCIRPDGAVMAIADQTGKIEIMDTKQKFNLRTFKDHKKRVNSLQYEGNYLYTGGDDMTLRLYDVSGGNIIHSYENAHDDYIKSIKTLSQGHILSAGYDKKIKLYDFRVHQDPQIIFDFNQPIQSIDTFNSKLSFVACGSKKLAIFDIRYEKSIIQSITSKKLLTSVHAADNSSRVMTISHDNYFKIYRNDTLQVTYQQKFPTSIQCFDITSNECHIAFGLASGELVMKTKNSKQSQSQGESQQFEDGVMQWFKSNENNTVKLNDKYFYRGVYQKPKSFDIKFESIKAKKVSIYDQCLKKFEYKKALITSLEKNNYLIFIALVDEYIQRGCLERTIQTLSENDIAKIVDLLTPLIHNVKYSSTALLVLQLLLNFHKETVNVNWNKLYEQIESEKDTIQQLWKLDGMLELIEENLG